MKKLTLDQLEVENFAFQPSEEELTNVKGGTTVSCGVSALAGAAMYASVEASKVSGSNVQSSMAKSAVTFTGPSETSSKAFY